jgi:4-amino-4-deoxy-L-arabinose transferase-like glycosyltransferase
LDGWIWRTLSGKDVVARRTMRRFHVAAILLLFAGGAVCYLWRVPTDPPGSYLDESSICYNAHTISQTGRDEYGVAWPLFFRAFGEHKNPALIYLIAALFKVTGPSIAVARYCTASLGLFTGVLLGLLGWEMTKRFVLAAAVAVMAWLTPWLFECSRVVLEVAFYPCLLALFLLAVWRASRKTKWTWGDVVALTTTLALLTYSYSIGRLLGPLLAIGLALLVTTGGWRSLLKVWVGYGVFLVPLLIFHQRHPGSLTDRFKALTYVTDDKSAWAILSEFIGRYVADVNPSRWLISGGTDVRDHVAGTGSMLAAIVLLGLVGLFLVARDHWREPWWRFVLYGLLVSVVPGALTRNEFSQLRLIAFPIFFMVLTIPAMEWLIPAPGGKASGLPKRVVFAGTMLAVAIQGGHFQWLYHRSTPGLWYVFEARFPQKVLGPALATGSKQLYLIDGPGKSGYIQALWHGVLAGIERERFVRLEPGAPVPPGAVAISTEAACDNCQLIARSGPPSRPEMCRRRSPRTKSLRLISW